MDEYPDTLAYNKDHSWVKFEGDIAIVGIIGPAAKKAKEFVFIQLPQKGEHIKKGDTYVTLEAVKWTGELISPVSGEIVQVNDDLFDDPHTINKQPYDQWIMKVKTNEKEQLMDAHQARQYYADN